MSESVGAAVLEAMEGLEADLKRASRFPKGDRWDFSRDDVRVVLAALRKFAGHEQNRPET